MVFSGRPSTACGPCRQGRLKCDRVVPACGQCGRKKIPCPGYRDPSQVRFRDETVRIASRVKNAKTKKKPPITPSSGVSSFELDQSPELAGDCEFQDHAQARTVVSLRPQELVVDPEHAALAYFMNSFIVTSPFEGYLPDLYKSHSATKHDALSSATQAVSFATFALRVRDPAYLKTAWSNYAVALLETNALLASPKDAVLDSSLAAVLLLGLFEATVFRGQQSPESWTAHTLGAVQLLRLRGSKQFRSKVSSQLFSQTITNIRTSCVQRAIAVPTEFLTLTDEAMEFLNAKDPALRLGPIVDRAASIRARAEECPGTEFIAEAAIIDQEVVDFIASFEEGLQYTVRDKEDTPPWAYLGIAHRYPSHRVAKFWNAIRMIRMFLNDLIWDSALIGLKDEHCYEVYPPSPCGPHCNCSYFTGIQALAANGLELMATDVLASIPEFVEQQASEREVHPAARTLVWPLFLLQKFTPCSQLARKYALSCLNELGRDLNMPQVVEVASMCEVSTFQDDW
ncbi:Fc.00g024330.m01.CDS01 [Cosmosporella sp. VM-42]